MGLEAEQRLSHKIWRQAFFTDILKVLDVVFGATKLLFDGNCGICSKTGAF